MTINPLILDKVSKLDIPKELKKSLNDILEIEDRLETTRASKELFKNIGDFLHEQASNPDIAKFCENYE